MKDLNSMTDAELRLIVANYLEPRPVFLCPDSISKLRCWQHDSHINGIYPSTFIYTIPREIAIKLASLLNIR